MELWCGFWSLWTPFCLSVVCCCTIRPGAQAADLYMREDDRRYMLLHDAGKSRQCLMMRHFWLISRDGRGDSLPVKRNHGGILKGKLLHFNTSNPHWKEEGRKRTISTLSPFQLPLGDRKTGARCSELRSHVDVTLRSWPGSKRKVSLWSEHWNWGRWVGVLWQPPPHPVGAAELSVKLCDRFMEWNRQTVNR